MKFLLMIVLSSVFLSSEFSIAASPRDVPVRSARSLRQQVDSYAELMQKEVFKVKKTKDKFKALQSSLRQIQSLRAESAAQSEGDEAHMNLMVSVLESLPKEKEFKKKNCAAYESEFMSTYEPTDEEAPTEPAVLPAWQFLQAVCI